MYCVIQKIQNKKMNIFGEHKKIEIWARILKINDEPSKIRYSYRYGEECFDRTILDAYKISIHKSYRENGTVKKKQWSICTMGFYDFIDLHPFDCVIGGERELKLKLIKIGITEDELWTKVDEKIILLKGIILKEFATSDEARAKKNHQEILSKHQKGKKIFEEKYGQDSYDYCYDVFGTLRNKIYLKQLEDDYESQQKYRRNSYNDNSSSNYSDNNFSGYSKHKHSNYTEEEKENLKKIYKKLAFEYHPDYTKDDGMMMKLVNKVKGEWGI